MFSFQFSSDEDRKQVLEMGSLHIASQLFILRPWKLFVEAEFNDLKTIPVWVVMKKFPMELWDDEGFGRIVSAIGTPLFVDKLTETMARISYARVRGHEKQKEGGSLTGSSNETMENTSMADGEVNEVMENTSMADAPIIDET
ncbi:hypothetical protein FRX31_029400, partial [Thalictrum thalictroides]